MSVYQKLRDKFEDYRRRKGVKVMSKEALRWYKNYTNRYISPKSVSFKRTTDLGIFSSNLVPGKFYLYQYDPKTKDQLPYYDTLPLVLVTEITPNGWYGINFHYMPPAIRLKIMEGFYDTLISTKLSPNLKLKLNWRRAVAIANAVSAHKYLRHSIKRYLGNHITSSLVELDPQYWALCIFLPLSRFKKKSADYIWKDV